MQLVNLFIQIEFTDKWNSIYVNEIKGLICQQKIRHKNMNYKNKFNNLYFLIQIWISKFNYAKLLDY